MQRERAAARPQRRSVPTPLQTCQRQHLPQRPARQHQCSLRPAAPSIPLATPSCPALQPAAGLAEAAPDLHGQWRRRRHRSRTSPHGGRRQPSSSISTHSSSTLSSSSSSPLVLARHCLPLLGWPAMIPLRALAPTPLLRMAMVATDSCVPAPLEATGLQGLCHMVQVSAWPAEMH